LNRIELEDARVARIGPETMKNTGKKLEGKE
jgi:hypothetical protein